MILQEAQDYTVKEINKNLEIIRKAKNEKYDEFAKEKVKALVDVLDLIDECSSENELADGVKLLYRGKQGALDGLNDLLQVMGHKK